MYNKLFTILIASVGVLLSVNNQQSIQLFLHIINIGEVSLSITNWPESTSRYV